MQLEDTVCKTAFYPLRHHGNIKDTMLLVFDCMIAILNLTSNLLVIYLIFKTKQYRNSSVKLILMLSISDMLTASISQPLFVYFLYYNFLPCRVTIFLQFVFFFFPYFSVYVIAFIVYDRYARITYLSRYHLLMSRRKLIFGIILALCATTIQDAIITLGTLQEKPKISGFGVLPLNVITLVFEIVIYTKTINKLRLYKNERKQKKMPVADTSFTKLAAAYLLMIIIFFVPFMVINTVYTLYPKTSQSFLSIQYTWLISMIVYCINSFANAVIFLRVNRKAKVHLKLLVQRFLKTRLEHTQMSSNKDLSFFDMSVLNRGYSFESNNNDVMTRHESTSF